jgi:hypothetical protein
MLMMANSAFLASRARALLCIAHDPEVRARDIAACLWGANTRPHAVSWSFS